MFGKARETVWFFAAVGAGGVLIALLVWYIRGSVEALSVAVLLYFLSGIVLQRVEGSIPEKVVEDRRESRHPTNYGYLEEYERGPRIPDSSVSSNWRLRVILFWLPWFLAVRGGILVVLVLGPIRSLLFWGVLGYSWSKVPPWRAYARAERRAKRIRVFREFHTKQTQPSEPAVRDVSLEVPQNGAGGPNAKKALAESDMLVGAGSSKN